MRSTRAKRSGSASACAFIVSERIEALPIDRRGIVDLDTRLRSKRVAQRTARIIFIIVTDRQENAS